MSCEVAVSKQLRGLNLYYKYLLFPFVSTPVELIFIKRTDPNSCYRVIPVPQVLRHVKNVFDSCIYPQEPDEEQWLFSKVFFGKTIKVPDLSNDLKFCMKAHLKEEYDKIVLCDVHDAAKICEKILSVHGYLASAKKVSSSVNYKEMPFYESVANQVQ